MATNLEKEYQYYRANQRELAQKHIGKVLVIKEQQVIGLFDSELDAINETKKTHALGSFLVQKCERPEDSTPQVFQSRVLIQ